MAPLINRKRPAPGSTQKKKKTVRSRARRKETPTWMKWVRFGVIALLAAFLFYLLFVMSGDNVSIGQNLVGSVTTRVQSGLTNATNRVINFFENGRNYEELKKDYEALRRENDSLRLEVAANEEQVAENTRLSSLLGAYNKFSSLNPVYAKVIAHDPGVWFDTFSINIGESSGVKKDMAVITGDGLVGRVTDVGYNYAKVISVIDSRSAVACLIQRTRDTGVMRGVTTDTMTDAACYVYYLPANTDAMIGDAVITSGMDTLYPKGLPIGSISEVSRTSDTAENYVVVTPYVDFAHLEEVLVLRVETEKDSEETRAALPTPTPRPKKEETDLTLPTAAPKNTESPESDNDIWFYPTAAPTAPSDPADMGSMEGTWADGLIQ